MNKKLIGKFLKKLRDEKNLTQIQLSNQFGNIYSDATISKWERGVGNFVFIIYEFVLLK